MLQAKEATMSTLNSLSTEDRVKLAKAQALQMRRERWMEILQALPQPKTEMVEFPYATMDEALDDAFRQIKGGSEGAIKLMRDAWKTKQWRAQAERNRAARDAAAEIEEARAEVAEADRQLALLAETVGKAIE
jgi:crotonobetainyl-CoA:carnitine CoA-transferase CaiB-like acyl-CoA transferase